MQHSINNQNWFSNNSNSYGRSNGSILRDSARFVLPRNDYNSYNTRPSYNYSQRTYSQPKSYSNNNFPIENSNFNNRQVTDFRTNNLPTFNTREIRKNAESEYRSEYVPYSPEYYQPLRQKPRTIGRRLEVGKDYIFRNEEQKKSTPLLNLAEYHIPAALKKKLQLLDSDLILDDDFELPDISETNFNEKREDEEEEKVKENEENDENEEKEEKEEKEENEEKKEEPFVQPFIEDIEVDNALEFEKDEEDEKPEVCEKPEEVEKPENVIKLKDIQKPNKGNLSKPNQLDMNPIIDNVKGGTGKPNVNLLPQNEEKGKINEDKKPIRIINKKFDIENESIKQNESIPVRAAKKIINKEILEDKSKDIPIQVIEKEPQIESIPEEFKFKTVIKPSESEKPKETETNEQVTKSVKPDLDKKVTIESKKPIKPELEKLEIKETKVPKNPEPQIIETKKEPTKPVEEPKIINQIQNEIPTRNEDQISLKRQTNIIKNEPKKEFVPIKAEYTDYEQEELNHKVTSAEENKIVKQQRQKFIPEQVHYEEDDNPKEPEPEPEPVLEEEYKEQKDESDDKNKISEDNKNKDNEGVSIIQQYDDDSNASHKHRITTFLMHKTMVKEMVENKTDNDNDNDENEPDETYSGIIEGIKSNDKSSEDVEIKDEYPVDNYLDKEVFLRKHYIKTYAYPPKQPKFEEEEIKFNEEEYNGYDKEDAGVAKRKKEKFESQSVEYDDGKNEGDKIDQGGVTKKKKKRKI